MVSATPCDYRNTARSIRERIDSEITQTILCEMYTFLNALQTRASSTSIIDSFKFTSCHLLQTVYDIFLLRVNLS